MCGTVDRRFATVLLCVMLVTASCTDWNEHAALDTVRTGVAPSGVRVLIVGIDGATFSIIDPMIADGELPQMARLLREGGRARLRSVEPMKSPALWTSMVTGRTRQEHGIEDFVVRQADHGRAGSSRRPQLVSALERRSPALWNMATAFELSSGVTGWWATWPAEPVHGYVVSDRVARSRWGEWTADRVVERRTYPESLMEELASLIVDPAAPPVDAFAELIDWTAAEREEFLDVERPLFAHGLSVFKFSHCNQLSYERMALRLLDGAPQPDLALVFLIGLDPVSHTFWHLYEPRSFTGVDPAEAARLGTVIPSYYRHNDEFLGRLLSTVDPATVVLVVSDHGFQASGDLPRRRSRNEFAALREAAKSTGQVAVGQSGKHHPDGILIAAGGPIRAGSSVEAGIHDITPTVLALLGLPVGRDMAGRVLTELVDPEFWRQHPIRYVDSYDRLLDWRGIEGIQPLPDPQLMDQLRALGYVDDEEPAASERPPDE
jgi:predicted AlkP superfamily phosphohydrolase/phosphomutase